LPSLAGSATFSAAPGARVCSSPAASPTSSPPASLITSSGTKGCEAVVDWLLMVASITAAPSGPGAAARFTPETPTPPSAASATLRRRASRRGKAQALDGGRRRQRGRARGHAVGLQEAFELAARRGQRLAVGRAVGQQAVGQRVQPALGQVDRAGDEVAEFRLGLLQRDHVQVAEARFGIQPGAEPGNLGGDCKPWLFDR
jgi:hypothetical protein